MKYFLLLIAILFISSCDSSIKTTPEEDIKLDQLTKILYQSTVPLFASYKEDLQKEKPQNGLPWVKEYDNISFLDFMNMYEEKAELFVTNNIIGEKVNLAEEYRLDQRFLESELVSSDLKSYSGEVIILDKTGSFNNGSSSKSKRVNGKFLSVNFNTFGVNFRTQNKSELPKGIKGTMTYKITFADEFDIVKLDNSSIGTKMEFAGSNVTLEEINENQAVFQMSNMSSGDFQVKNVTPNNIELSLDLDKRKDLGLGFNVAEKTGLIDRTVYDIFKANPKITLESFGKKVRNHLVAKIRGELSDADQVFVTNMLGPIQVLALYSQKTKQPKERVFSVTIP